MANVELMLPFNPYRRALSIPFADSQRFSVCPLAWLCYIAYTIYGRKGHISISPDGPAIDYHMVDIQPRRYYYVSQDPLLLDPDVMDDRTSVQSDVTARRVDFRQKVTDRDESCILSGSCVNLQACHIIPHAKQHQYMINLASHRQDSDEILDPPFTSINDTRNGILLHHIFHRPFGESGVAFLHTPNFVVDVFDVAQALPPGTVASSASLAERRLTFQHFNTDDPVLNTVAPHNTDARISDDDEWPPDFVFDIAYGRAAFEAWGTRDIYYSVGDNGGNANGGSDDITGGKGKPSKSALERAERYARRQAKSVGRQASDTADTRSPDFHDIILGLWMHNSKRDQHKALAVKADRTKEKVQTWRDSVQ